MIRYEYVTSHTPFTVCSSEGSELILSSHQEPMMHVGGKSRETFPTYAHHGLLFSLIYSIQTCGQQSIRPGEKKKINLN